MPYDPEILARDLGVAVGVYTVEELCAAFEIPPDGDNVGPGLAHDDTHK